MGHPSRHGMLDQIQYLTYKATRMIDAKETPQDHESYPANLPPREWAFSLRLYIHAAIVSGSSGDVQGQTILLPKTNCTCQGEEAGLSPQFQEPEPA